MKPAVAAIPAAPAVVGRGVSRLSPRRKSVAADKLPPCDSPADIPKLLRAMGRIGFMRHGRPEDYNEPRKRQ